VHLIAFVLKKQQAGADISDKYPIHYERFAMTEINADHFIEELRYDIETKDMIKARLVLAHFEEVEPATQKLALSELGNAPGTFVLPLLVGLLANKPQLADSYPTLKEILFSKALDNPVELSKMLIREIKPTHKVVLAELAGEIRLDSATPILLGILSEDQDEKVLRGSITALGMIGDPTATTPVSEFLYSGSVELIIAAIQALGQLNTPTAIQRLADKLGADQDLDYMILDVFACSQEPEALERLNAMLSAQHAHLRNASKQHLTQIGPKAVPVLTRNLRYDDPDLLIHTLNVLGAIGDESAIAPIRKLLHNEPKDANVRFAAYEALGTLPVAKGAFALAQGLHDPVDNVRAAAAGAINHNYNTVLAAGIKNMVRDEDGAERPISHTIIDAQCDAIFLDLVQEDPFQDYALEYLSHRAHGDTRNHFLELLCANGLAELGSRINGQPVSAGNQQALKIFVVDDSKMILNIYRSVLHNLGCQPVLFDLPEEAVREVREQKPNLIFTDLNMPEMNGVDLTRAVRQWFSKEQLPIIMVTTQNECQDNDAAYAAGITAILHKPFTEDMLRAAMEKHLHLSSIN
jgi:CheY-like chemotaxis protein/HEAT repeat protein